MVTTTIEEKDEEKLSASENDKINGDDIDNRKIPIYKRVGVWWPVGLKIIQLILCIFSAALIMEPAKKTALRASHIHHFSFMSTTFLGYIVVNSVMLVGRLMGDRYPYRTNTVFSLLGCLLHLSSGILILADRSNYTDNLIYHPNKYYMDMMCAAGIFGVLNSLFFLVDAILTYRYKKDL